MTTAYITDIGPRAIKGIELIGGCWFDISTKRKANTKQIERAHVSHLIEVYETTTPEALKAKIDGYRKQVYG